MKFLVLSRIIRRTDVTISSKSLPIFVAPHLNPPLRMGGLAYGFVLRILYRGSSLKFTAFFSSNSRYLNPNQYWGYSLKIVTDSYELLAI